MGISLPGATDIGLWRTVRANKAARAASRDGTLIDLDAGLVVEFDGADHREAARHTRDVVKEDALRRVGLEVVRVTGSEVDNQVLVADRVRAGRARAKFEPEAQRRWVARPAADTLHDLIKERALVRSLAEPH